MNNPPMTLERLEAHLDGLNEKKVLVRFPLFGMVELAMFGVLCSFNTPDDESEPAFIVQPSTGSSGMHMRFTAKDIYSLAVETHKNANGTYSMPVITLKNTLAVVTETIDKLTRDGNLPEQ
jgi:hypothetical protein